MERKFRYFMAIPLTDLEKNHPGYHLKRVRKLLDVKQCKVVEKTAHCDSTISDLERLRKNPKFYTIQSYLKALGVEFYAFVPADGVASVSKEDKSEFILVQVSHEELMQIRKSA